MKLNDTAGTENENERYYTKAARLQLGESAKRTRLTQEIQAKKPRNQDERTKEPLGEIELGKYG